MIRKYTGKVIPQKEDDTPFILSNLLLGSSSTKETNLPAMQTLARSVHGVMDEMRQIHMDYRNPVEEKG